MRHRKRIEISCSTSWVESEQTLPNSFIIKRVRAIADSPGTQVALSIRELSEPTSLLDIPLEYSLGDSPIDSEENILVRASRVGSNLQGKIWVAAKANTSCIVKITIEYEADDRT